MPDAKTIWLFRERLKEHGLVEDLFQEVLSQIDAAGFVARCGQMVDATMVSAPGQRNSRTENAAIKAGETPSDWSKAKLRQKDGDARAGRESVAIRITATRAISAWIASTR